MTNSLQKGGTAQRSLYSQYKWLCVSWWSTMAHVTSTKEKTVGTADEENLPAPRAVPQNMLGL